MGEECVKDAGVGSRASSSVGDDSVTVRISSKGEACRLTHRRDGLVG